MERGQTGIFQNRAIHRLPRGHALHPRHRGNLENIARGRYNSEAGTMG